MLHNERMTLLTARGDQRTGTSLPTVTVGVALVVAELLLAGLWFPWVVNHLVFGGNQQPFLVVRALIVFPEYLLLAGAVLLIGRSPARRAIAAALAVSAAVLIWLGDLVLTHVGNSPVALDLHRALDTAINDALLIVVPVLGAAAWGIARRSGRLWVLSLLLAPALRWLVDRGDWWYRIAGDYGFRVSEVVGMSLVIVPVLLAILAGWALEQVERPPPA